MADATGTTAPLPPAEGPVRVVIDTDAANEIDDQFALAWALLAPDRLAIEAIHAAPYGHGHYFAELAAAVTARGDGPATMFEELAVGLGPDHVAEMSATTTPAAGMQASLAEIKRIVAAANLATPPPVRRGSEDFLTDAETPVPSPAAEHLVELAHSGDGPLYVAIMGAPTNVAAALLLDPSIAARIVPVFVAGYPSASRHVDDSFNLVQDRLATRRLFAPDVSLVYLPGYQVSETLSISLPEIDAHIAPHGPLGELLRVLYLENPLANQPDRPGHSWVMWDLAPLAWLIDPTWVRAFDAPGATIGADHRWEPAPGGHTEAFRLDRRSVYTDLFARFAATSGADGQ